MPASVLPFQTGDKKNLTSLERHEANTFCRRLVRDPEYQKRLLTDFRSRNVSSQIEMTVWAYAYGKPPERIEIENVTSQTALESMSRDDLAARCDALAAFLRRPCESPTDEEIEEAERRTDEAEEATRKRLTRKLEHADNDSLSPSKLADLLSKDSGCQQS